MKIQRISEFQHEFSFLSSTQNRDAYYARFLESDLGKIHSAMPWKELISVFNLKESNKGSKMVFSPQGRLALMFLKHYCCQSDKRLIEQLNSNIDYQFFCDIHLGFNRLTNFKIVSQIRCELATKLDIDKAEQVLYKYWKPFIANPNHITVDATCYESEVRYPSSQKLLWESLSWLYNQLRIHCKILGIKLPRSKFLKWKKRYQGYSKMRRKTVKKKTALTRALLHLLDKFLNFETTLHHQNHIVFTKAYYQRVAIIKKVYIQQLSYFKTGESPTNRIVSIAKDYLRPIVRGKEIKAVEFGAKVNKIQIDGINFIEHLNFNSFNEGTRLKSTVFKVQRLTKTKTKIIGADAIYATNSNRKFITKHKIQTDFRPKGKQSKKHKEQQKLRTLITKERATRLEGSFGKEKEYYHLKKIKAKTKPTERLWIFFGIHTANALEIGRRKAQSLLLKSA